MGGDDAAADETFAGTFFDRTVALTQGTTYENRANLAVHFLAQIVRKYEGTRLGRQEIEAEILDDVPGGLWSRGVVEAARVRSAPVLSRIVVSIDPAATSGEGADETGVRLGRMGRAMAGSFADLSGRYPPVEWAKAAVAAYRAHKADRIVAEVNNGGEMVEATLRVIDPNLAFAPVYASHGKITRAEPVAALGGKSPSSRCVPTA